MGAYSVVMDSSMSPRQYTAIIRTGGLSLIIGALAFVSVFAYLAAKFNYPDVLDGEASLVLPALLETGGAGRLIWAIYSLLPLFWLPASIGAFYALRPKSEGLMRLSVLFASISSLAMTLGLMRWPGFHWELGRAWAADAAVRPALRVVFDAVNLYLGNYIGEFLGELCINSFFFLSACAMLKGDGVPRSVGMLGMAASIVGFVAMFRNVTSTIDPVAALNNYLLPMWMIVFGVVLLRYSYNSRVFGASPIPTAA